MYVFVLTTETHDNDHHRGPSEFEVLGVYTSEEQAILKKHSVMIEFVKTRIDDDKELEDFNNFLSLWENGGGSEDDLYRIYNRYADCHEYVDYIHSTDIHKLRLV